MVYGYIRITADRRAIAMFCKQNGVAVDKWHSGRLPRALQKDDVLVCSEISKLGRDLPAVASALRACAEKGVKVWSVRDGWHSLSQLVVLFKLPFEFCVFCPQLVYLQFVGSSFCAEIFSTFLQWIKGRKSTTGQS